MLTLVLLCALCPPGVPQEVGRILPELTIRWVPSLNGAEGPAASIQVRGNCQVPQEAPNLGWVERVDGDILPFVTIDCAAIRYLVSSPVFMPRALAQVIVHELFHYLTGRVSHSSGLNSAKLGRRELESQGILPKEDRESLDLVLHLMKKEI